MGKDIAVGMVYVIFSFCDGQWWMILKFILTFNCNACRGHVFWAGGTMKNDSEGDMSSRDYELRQCVLMRGGCSCRCGSFRLSCKCVIKREKMSSYDGTSVKKV